ncbi:MAG: tetratricopeptide (TPR) repeat protein [Paracoccaceae bacterium]|jgi:tetratricopeptide (TPR) repeat protein
MMDSLRIPPESTAVFDRVGEEFLAAIYSAATARQPHNIEALAELGHVYTRLGRYQDGLEVDHKLVDFAPLDPNVRYNLACSQALLGLHDEACSTLETAFELGYDDAPHLRDDDDLSSLHGLPRFEALLRRIAADDSDQPST